MKKSLSSIKRAYLAGFLDGDGSIYVRLKPNTDYRYGFQVAPAVILFQSAQDRFQFEELCSLIKLGYIRERNDGILEYTINKMDNIREFLSLVEPFVILKKKQIVLMKKILELKKKVENQKDFRALMKLIDTFRELNYSKKRKVRTLTP
jgi:intein/homing endonuclease